MSERLRRRLWIALAVVLVAAAIVTVVLLRRRAAPEAARLLPEADTVIYVNLRALRLTNVFGRTPPATHDPEYEEFVKATGFQFERDLDQAAFAVHAAGSAVNPIPPGREAAPLGEITRFSEIFVGRFDSDRATAYFKKLATAVERHRDADIFTIPHEGRTVRVAILGAGMVAVSNVQGPQVIHEMIDHHRAAALAVAGPSVLRDYYQHVPLGSVAWAIGKVAALQRPGASLPLPGGLEIPSTSLAGSTIVASARYLGAVHLRVEAFTPAEDNAKRMVGTLETLLALSRSAESALPAGGADPDVKAFFDSLKVEQHGSRALLTATLPPGFLRKAVSEPPPTVTAPAPKVEEKATPQRGRKSKVK